jgi:cyclopropane fatty-acyl-phospholipid synthase-like methyltransferase
LPSWWVDGPHSLIRRTVESGWLPPGCSILEIGCGAGQQAAWLSQNGFRVVGFDFSPEAIERACREYATPGGPQFVVADVTRGEQPDVVSGTFDAIIDAGCFHTISHDQLEHYLDNVVSWSRAGTRFVLMAPCFDMEPAQRFHQVRVLFQNSFDLIFCEESLGCLPRRPELKIMVFRLQRR